MLFDEGYLPYLDDAESKRLKKEKVEKYLLYCKELGTLTEDDSAEYLM